MPHGTGDYFDRFEGGAAVDYHSQPADGLLNQAVWLGPPLPQAPERLALAWHSAAEQVEAQVHPTGDAFAPLAWLVGFCTSAESACAQGGSLSRLVKWPVAPAGQSAGEYRIWRAGPGASGICHRALPSLGPFTG